MKITRPVKRIAIVLVSISIVCYGGFVWWWSAQTQALDEASRPVEALARFDTSNAVVPVERILSGGPPPDGIPSIDQPKFAPVSEVDFLRERDEVIVYSNGDETRIYPFRILVWHEVVNDHFGGEPIAVTYCPLCGTAMVFDRRLDGETLVFGVSGLLYNSDVLMFDRQTESLWTQLGRRAISGTLVGKELKWLPSKQMTWAAAKEQHPSASVLALDTGYKKHYDSEAYVEYKNSPRNSFPVMFTRDELPRKAWVVGVEINGVPKAYPLGSLPTETRFTDVIGTVKVSVSYDPATQFASVIDDETGKAIPSVRAYWFAWQAFYPETEVWREETTLD